MIDASNETVIPGLIEIHTHLSKSYGEALGRAFLAWGITTVRNPATNTFETLENRESFESAIEAQEDLERVLGDSDYLAAPTTLEAFLKHYQAEAHDAHGDVEPAPDGEGGHLSFSWNSVRTSRSVEPTCAGCVPSSSNGN